MGDEVRVTHLTPYVFLVKRFADMGLVAQSSTPEEFGKFLQSEIARWRAILARKP
jgi:tripartite-type tricarboxylate transporter receptor subunit TctC